MSTQQNQPDLSAVIAENFGANATYVESLLQRFRSNPALVDEAWRAYFVELLGTQAPAENGGDATTAAARTGDGPTAATASTTTTAPQHQSQTPPAAEAYTQTGAGAQGSPTKPGSGATAQRTAAAA